MSVFVFDVRAMNICHCKLFGAGVEIAEATRSWARPGVATTVKSMYGTDKACLKVASG